MRVKLLVPLLAAGLIGATGCYIDDFGGFGRFPKDFHYSYPLKSGGRLSLESFNGTVDLSGWDQETVDISGTKYGPSPDAADSLKIEIDNSPDSVSVRAVRPSELRGGWGVRFVVKMPRRAVLDLIKTSNGQIRVMDGSGPARLRTSNGQIHVQAFQGSVDAQTSNGSVELTDMTGEAMVRTSNGHIHADNHKGPLQASTSNGTITANLAATGDRPLRLETSNGSVDLTLPAKFDTDVRVNSSNGHITLHLPAEVNARLQARTNNASVTSDFEVRAQGEFRKNRLDGVIGNGGPLLDLTTSNASIRLMRM
jgi:Putative adhesin